MIISYGYVDKEGGYWNVQTVEAIEQHVSLRQFYEQNEIAWQHWLFKSLECGRASRQGENMNQRHNDALPPRTTMVTSQAQIDSEIQEYFHVRQ